MVAWKTQIIGDVLGPSQGPKKINDRLITRTGTNCPKDMENETACGDGSAVPAARGCGLKCFG